MVSDRQLNNTSWKQYTLNEVTDKVGSGKTPLGGESTYKSHGVALIRSQNIRNNKVDFSDVVYIDNETDQSMSNSFVYKNDILLNITGASIGRSAVYRKETHANVNQHVCIIRPKKIINSFFLQQLLVSQYGQAQINAFQAGGGREGLNFRQIRSMKFAFPLFPEQEIIASVLSDLDVFIADLEKLIIKKKNIKTGVMQELLTGKRRLPGYTGEWKKVNLSKTAQIKARIGWQGLTTAEYLNDGYSILVTGTDFEDGSIKWKTCHYVSRERYEQDPYIQLKNGDVLITKDGTIGKVAIVDNLHKPATLNSGIFVVRSLSGDYSNKFLYYVLMSNIFKSFVAELQAGSTIIHLYQKDLIKFDFFVPPTEKEQDSIVDCIQDMDREINILEKKYRKLVNMKIGIMQKLLTGEIRLV